MPGFQGMNPETVDDVADALLQANGAVAGAWRTLKAVWERRDAVQGERGRLCYEAIGPVVPRAERCAQIANALVGKLLEDIGEQEEASRGAEPGHGIMHAGATTQAPVTGPPPIEAPPPRPLGFVPRPSAPGQFPIPGGPTIPQDIVFDRRGNPVVQPPEGRIPWGLLGRIGARAGGVLGVLDILFVPSNKTPDWVAESADGTPIRFATERDMWTYRHERWRLERAGLDTPIGDPPPVETPPVVDPGDNRVIVEPDSPAPVIAPGDGTLGPIREPGSPPVPLELAHRESLLEPFVYRDHAGRESLLTDDQRALVREELRRGQLSENTAAWLRAEARRMWRDATAGLPEYELWQPGPDFQVHHIRDLRWAHLYPEAYPNDLSNLALWGTGPHGDWTTDVMRREREMLAGLDEQRVTGAEALLRRREFAEQITAEFQSRMDTDPWVVPLSAVPRVPAPR